MLHSFGHDLDECTETVSRSPEVLSGEHITVTAQTDRPL